MIDQTPAQRPLLAWSELWGVRARHQLECTLRLIMTIDLTVQTSVYDARGYGTYDMTSGLGQPAFPPPELYDQSDASGHDPELTGEPSD